MKILFAGKKPIGSRILNWLIKEKHENSVLFKGADNVRNWWRRYRHEVISVSRLAKIHSLPSLEHISSSEQNFELLVSVQTSQIFTAIELNSFPLGCINLHFAPLPEYKGCNSLSHAILNGDTEYGVTLHWMDPKVDAGPVFAREMFPISKTETVWDIYKKCEEAAFKLFTENFNAVCEGRNKNPGYFPQAKKTYYYNRNSLTNLKRLNGLEGKELYDRVRALSFPGYSLPFFETPEGPVYASFLPMLPVDVK